MVRKRKTPLDPPDNRGGVRQGQPGTAYAQRTDLNANRAGAQPIRTAPGQEYGKATAQAASQRVVPLAAAPPTPSGPAGASTFGGDLAHVAMPDNYIGPGEVTPLHAPTERPGEPLTHGLPLGPGAGPEALGGAMQVDTLGALLRQAAITSGASPEVKALAQWVGGQPR